MALGFIFQLWAVAYAGRETEFILVFVYEISKSIVTAEPGL